MQVSGVVHVSTAADGKPIMEVAGRPVFLLNRVALSIWNKLAAGHSPREISSELAREFNVSEELTTKDVSGFIEKLKLHCLLYDDE